MKLLSEDNQIIDLSSKLTIIETKIYFEAYRHVLYALKETPSYQQFPLIHSILKLNTQPTPPDYITPTTTYDFTPLLLHSTSHTETNSKRLNPIDNKYQKVTLLSKEQWPTSEQLHLNPKQYDALILALTNQVALIQGRKYPSMISTKSNFNFLFNFSTRDWKNLSRRTNH